MNNDNKYLNNPILDTEVEIRKVINSGYRFYKKVVLESAKSGTPVEILTASVVEELTKALGFSGLYVEGFKFNVAGSTAWAGMTDVKIKDTADTPNTLVTIAQAQLGADAYVNENGTVTLSDDYKKGAIIANKKGLQVVADSDASAGDDLVVQVWGRII